MNPEVEAAVQALYAEFNNTRPSDFQRRAQIMTEITALSQSVQPEPQQITQEQIGPVPTVQEPVLQVVEPTRPGLTQPADFNVQPGGNNITPGPRRQQPDILSPISTRQIFNVAPTQQPNPQQQSVAEFLQSGGGGRQLTFAELLAQRNAAASGQQAAPKNLPGTDLGGGARFIPLPTTTPLAQLRRLGVDFDIPGEFGRIEAERQRMRDEAAASEAEIARLMSGEQAFQTEDIQGNVRIVTTPEEAEAAIAEGKVPVIARDANLIREAARNEADALMQVADTDVDLARRLESQLAGENVGAGIGSAIATLLSGRAATQGLSELQQRTKSAQEEVVNALRRRSRARGQASTLDTRGRMDALMAELQPFEVVTGLIQEQERKRQEQRIAEIQRQRDRRDRFLTQDRAAENARMNLISTISNLARPVAQQGRIYQPNATNLKQQAELVAAQQGMMLGAQLFNNVKDAAARIGQRFSESGGLFSNVDEDAANKELNEAMINLKRLRDQVQNFKKLNGVEPPVQLQMALQEAETVFAPIFAEFQSAGALNDAGLADIEAADTEFLGLGRDVTRLLKDVAPSLSSFGGGSQTARGSITNALGN